jgi:hypothetical protein
MRSTFLVCLLIATSAALAACNTPTGSNICRGDRCQCVAGQPCEHQCSGDDPECNVQCAPGQPCDVDCAPGESCHVECTTASSCDVDCSGSPDCHVTCPATGCTVESCSGPSCVVACGLTGVPRRTGTTATCP